MDFSLDLLSRRRKFIVSLFCCAHDTCDGKFIFCTHEVQCVRQFSHRKMWVKQFSSLFAHTSPSFSKLFLSFIDSRFLYELNTCWKFLRIIHQTGNHAIYRRLTHFQHPNQIVANLSPQISSEINWKTLSKQQVWSIVRVSADKKLHTLRHRAMNNENSWWEESEATNLCSRDIYLLPAYRVKIVETMGLLWKFSERWKLVQYWRCIKR
jgi:hypothetical protein